MIIALTRINEVIEFSTVKSVKKERKDAKHFKDPLKEIINKGEIKKYIKVSDN